MLHASIFNKQREEIIIFKYKFKDEKRNLIFNARDITVTFAFFIYSQLFPNYKLKKIFNAFKVKIINLL